MVARMEHKTGLEELIYFMACRQEDGENDILGEDELHTLLRRAEVILVRRRAKETLNE